MAKIPKFKSEEEEVKFWDEHTLDEFAEDLEPAEDVEFVKPRKKLISLRMDPHQITALKKLHPERA
ncbi:MAG: CopG family antitoxin [Candidatus Eremiobacteraeota bacterium]|nr:CopG family antitoxin [Candidatus Eremiobacteraeota bacterium]